MRINPVGILLWLLLAVAGYMIWGPLGFIAVAIVLLMIEGATNTPR
jgi:hypothetical protein